ncbi:twin-arginine translocation pathway signal protein [Arsukibacterium ikkense]|uniref:Twin-arginine translocation pathway signal protein n=1 Tax=Arsukibacterium ikkense TaxID=336831 RepID=A0A0M2V5P1_9GAMM|nr:FAD/NAD(P)-binding oxidoreductase [Arsukibacterium ikkense]KKO44975.1 twin-arginine translocation pathway signal protein [Arsukibacterium ikkense]
MNPNKPAQPLRRRMLKLGLTAAALSASPLPALAGKQHSTAHIVIIGVGAAGLAMANRLRRNVTGNRITLVGQRAEHHYQPGYTMIASGLWPEKKVLSTTSQWLPEGVDWQAADVTAIDAAQQQLSLSNNTRLHYDLLVVATGCQLNYSQIEGFSPELIGQHGIGSVYAGPQAAAATSRQIEQLISQGQGRAIFTLCDTPLKCAGAPLKMTFTTLSRLEKSGKRQQFQVDFFSPFKQRVFSVPVYNDFVLQRWQEQQVGFFDQRKLTAIDAGANTAYFTGADGLSQSEAYDFIHVVPPMSAPDVVRQSDLVWQSGAFAGNWLEVDQYSLQHRRYPNVFGVGDVIGTPFGKTAASVKLQAPVAEQNILAYLAGQPLPARYNGYTSCPLITSIGRAILSEFGYEGKLMPSFSFISPTEESWTVWMMKEQMLQPAYNAMLHGRV